MSSFLGSFYNTECFWVVFFSHFHIYSLLPSHLMPFTHAAVCTGEFERLITGIHFRQHIPHLWCVNAVLLQCTTKCTDEESLCCHYSKLPLHVTECNYCCLLSIHTGMNKGGTVQCNTQDLSTKAHMEKKKKKDILHYCVCSSVLISMKYPHSFWCSAGRFTSFSCGLCHTEAQSVQIFVLIKPPHCSVQPGMCSWG